MGLDPAYRPITVDEFLAIDFGMDRKFELVDGVIQMMTGGSAFHANVAGNIYFALREKLRGTGCRPFNSDMGLRIDETNVRYPDVAVYCGKELLFPDQDVRAFADPVVIFEVLSPSTTRIDQGSKAREYQQLTSLEALVFVDPVNRLTRVVERVAHEPNSWADHGFAAPHDVSLAALGITLTEAEIFARD